MNIFLRAVITGFGYSLGASLYKKVSKRFENDESAEDTDRAAAPAPPFAAGKRAADEDADGSDDTADPIDGDAPTSGQPSEPNH